MNQYADHLAMALRATGFIEPVSWDVDPHTGATKALCRIPKDRSKDWASLVHAVLLKEESMRGTPGQWTSHICRLYMLREGRLIYGWFFCVTPIRITELMHTIDIVCGVLRGGPPTQQPQRQAATRPKHGGPPNPAVLGVYSPPLEADAAGNPIVPSRAVPEEMVIPMAGLPSNYDRNRPSRGGKGSQISSASKPFNPRRS